MVGPVSTARRNAHLWTCTWTDERRRRRRIRPHVAKDLRMSHTSPRAGKTTRKPTATKANARLAPIGAVSQGCRDRTTRMGGSANPIGLLTGCERTINLRRLEQLLFTSVSFRVLLFKSEYCRYYYACVHRPGKTLLASYKNEFDENKISIFFINKKNE